MTLALCFWIIMLVWLVFTGLTYSGHIANGWGGSLLIFILFLLLGWATFGAPIR